MHGGFHLSPVSMVDLSGQLHTSGDFIWVPLLLCSLQAVHFTHSQHSIVIGTGETNCSQQATS